MAKRPRKRVPLEARRAKYHRSYGSEFAALRRQWAKIVEAGDAFCNEPVCLMHTRHIEPGTAWDLSHAPDGITVIGPSHSRCNRSEAAKRGNGQRAKNTRRMIL